MVSSMNIEAVQETAIATMDKELLRKKLPSESAVLNDLLNEPDSMPVRVSSREGLIEESYFVT